MGSARSVGSLFIDIEARTARLEQDLAKVKNSLNGIDRDVKAHGDTWGRTTGDVEKNLVKFGGLLLGVRTMVSLVSHEMRDLIANVERVPGLSPDLVASIQEVRHNLVQARNDGNQMVANLVVGFATLGKAMGAAAGAFWQGMSLHSQGSTPGFGELFDMGMGRTKLTPDQLATDRDSTFPIKLAEAKERLAHATEMATKAGQDEAHAIITLREEAMRLRAEHINAEGFEMNSLELTNKRIQALNTEQLANEKLAAMRKQLKDAEEHVNKTLDKASKVFLSPAQAVDGYQQAVGRLRQELVALNAVLEKDPNNPVYIQKKVEATKKLADAQEGLNAALKKQGEMAREVANAWTEDLGAAIMRGEGLHELLNKLLGDLVRIVLQRSILNPLGDLLTGGLTKLFSFGGHAMGGPINGPTWVGENGPELLLPPGAGTIIPNDQLGGGGGRQTWQINVPPGASASDVYRLEQLVMQLAGPGVVERRAVAANVGAGMRGGGTARALNIR